MNKRLSDRELMELILDKLNALQQEIEDIKDSILTADDWEALEEAEDDYRNGRTVPL